jgi:hypothetical protein
MAGELTAVLIANPLVGPVALRQRQRQRQRQRPCPLHAPTVYPTTDTFIYPTYARGTFLLEGPTVLRRQHMTYSPPFQATFQITGTTKDSTGAALPGVTLHFFQANTPFGYIGTTTSDGSGNYTFITKDNNLTSADAYLVGSPDVAGRSINGLVITRVS